MKKTLAGFLVCLGLLLISFFSWVLIISQGEREAGFYPKEQFWDYQKIEPKKNLKKGERFSVMSWNIAFAHGEGSEGPGYEKKTYKEYLQRLMGFSSLINKEQVDFVFLQEVDFQSERTYDINEAQYLAKNASFYDTAPVLSWKVKHLPFPGKPWEFKKHFGKIESGGAILSRYRLEKHSYHLLPKPRRFSWLYNTFYLSRYIQMVQVLVAGKWETIVNVHLESYDKENRKEQLKKLLEMMKKIKPLLVVGDFNMSDGDKEGGFDFFTKEVPTNYGEALRDTLVFLGTFPAKKTERRLDYIFYNKDKLELLDGEVILRKRELSDHLPIVAQFLVRF